MIRRSKTDQEGEGRTVFVPLAMSEERCPVNALQAWLEIAGIGSGPIFRRINRHDGIVGDTALTGQSVALILKSAVISSKGIDAAKIVSGHSLRAGFVTEAATVVVCRPAQSWARRGIRAWKWPCGTSGQRRSGRFKAFYDNSSDRAFFRLSLWIPTISTA